MMIEAFTVLVSLPEENENGELSYKVALELNQEVFLGRPEDEIKELVKQFCGDVTSQLDNVEIDGLIDGGENKKQG